MTDYSLKNKVVVVTGATSGIGLSLSVLLAQEEMRLFLIGRSFAALKDKLSNVDRDFEATFIELDLENENEINDKLKVIKKENSIDCLIHCAGAISHELFESDKLKNLDRQYKVNLRSVYQITQFLLSSLKDSKGTILFLNSTAGLDAWENLSQYAATKHALRAMATSLRKELKGFCVKVTSLFCGSTDTPMQETVQMARNNIYDSKKFMNPEEVGKIIVSILKLPNEVMISELTVIGNK